MSASPAAAAPSTQFLERPEGRIAYDVQGVGPLLVLVPGMGELRSSYRFLTPRLVEAGYTVVTTDLRGHGESDTTFSAYGDPETASDISALIDSLGSSAVIIGNSLAAGAGVIVAADHPEQVTGLVLLGPFVRNPPAGRISLAMFRAMTAPFWVALMWKSYMPTLYSGRKPEDFKEYRDAVTASLRRPEYGRAFSLTTRQTDHDPAEARLLEVRAPVLVVMGERDPDFKDPAGEAHWIGETLKADVVMVPQAGHYPQSQQPEITERAILEFLESMGPRA
ncbi:alpha/beta fold hydrolase [Nesterenkonia sp. CF4.4]|uniref:alpha/beta fold hydrolase n=1 Tax=Nesterenkonia sp. CF4.4 TaxID=3373079 RepID=UPI003EE63EFB